MTNSHKSILRTGSCPPAEERRKQVTFGDMEAPIVIVFEYDQPEPLEEAIVKRSACCEIW